MIERTPKQLESRAERRKGSIVVLLNEIAHAIADNDHVYHLVWRIHVLRVAFKWDWTGAAEGTAKVSEERCHPKS